MVINEALQNARIKLSENNINSREARLLLAYSMGILPDDLIKYKECSEEEYEKFLLNLNRRINGEPFAYIVGFKEFMKLKFKVNEFVLIPREDTEILVQEVIKLNKKRILDMCTGSGCIAISLAKYIEKSNIDAVDISKDALNIAIENAKNNNVQVNFIESNLFEKVNSRYELIVSNPPYIPTKDINNLMKEVKQEPKIALDGGNDGLDFYKKISKEAINYLEDNGILIFEIGYDEAKSVCDILKNDGYTNIKVIKDLSENDRVVIAEKE